MTLLSQYADIMVSVFILTLVFVLLELWLPADPHQKLRSRYANWIYLPIVVLWVCLLQAALTPLHVAVITLTRGGLLPRLGLNTTSTGAQIGLGLAFAFTWDVWQYWIHRWQHSSPMLWQTHKFHHSDPELNASSQARHHALSYVVYMVSYAPLFVLFGAFTPHAVVSFLMFRIWGFVNHANLRIGFGPFTPVIAGPQFHRIHHSAEREHFDKNFAAFFPIIDRLFGTYYAPAANEYPETGLPANEETMLHQATISPFAAWFRLLRSDER